MGDKKLPSMSNKFLIPFRKPKPDSQVPSKDRRQTDPSRRKLPKPIALKRLILRERTVTSPVESFGFVTKSSPRAEKSVDSVVLPESLIKNSPEVSTSTTTGADGRVSLLHSTSNSQDENCDKHSTNSTKEERQMSSQLSDPLYLPPLNIEASGRLPTSAHVFTRQRSITTPVDIFKPSVRNMLDDHSDKARIQATLSKKGLPNSARARRHQRSLTSPVDTFKPSIQSSLVPEGQPGKSSSNGLPNPVLAMRRQRSLTSPVDTSDPNTILVSQTDQQSGQSKGRISFSKRHFLKLKRWQKSFASAGDKCKFHHASASETKEYNNTLVRQMSSSPEGSSTNQNTITPFVEPSLPLLGEPPGESKLDVLLTCDLKLSFRDTSVKDESLSSEENETILKIARAELESQFNEHLEWSPRKLRLSRLWSTSGIHVPPADPTADIFNIQVDM